MESVNCCHQKAATKTAKTARQSKPPAYRRQKARNADRAFVEVNGKRIYLGGWNSPESKSAYARIVGELAATGKVIDHQPDAEAVPAGLTVAELIAKFWIHAEQHYKGSLELLNFKYALRPLKELYGDIEASQFGPAKLLVVRNRMIELGWCRRIINQQVSKVRRVFRWGVAREWVAPGNLEALRALESLQAGRTNAPDHPKVEPVSDSVVNATSEHLTRTVAAMVRVQRLTGMRPAEVCRMKGDELDVTESVWVYRPKRHKTGYLGRKREVFIGKRAQAILSEFLRRDTQAYLFSPAEADAERRAERRANRKTALSCGNHEGTNVKANPRKKPGECYDTKTYNRAIGYACRRAFPMPEGLNAEEQKAWKRNHYWSANQLRHAFATEVRKHHGIEACQVLLGHAKCDITQVYAQRDMAKAADVARKIG